MFDRIFKKKEDEKEDNQAKLQDQVQAKTGLKDEESKQKEAEEA